MPSVFAELFDSIKYCYDSKKGKYSLDTYLDIVGEYTDRQILSTEKDESLRYLGGECQVERTLAQPDVISFSVTLFFQSASGEHVKKEAQRSLEITKFTSETAKTFVDKTMKFNIEYPGGHA